LIKTLIPFIFICLLHFSANSQNEKLSSPSPAPLFSEVSIGIPNLKPEQYEAVKASVSAIGGVKWAGFCEDQQYVFLFVNRKEVPDNETISNAILTVNSDLKLYYKSASINLLLNNCRDKEKAMTR